MALPDSHPFVTLDFKLDLSNPRNAYLPDLYPEPKTLAEKKALTLWPDQFASWQASKSPGRPRAITWPQVLNVVFHSIRQLSEGFDPQEQGIEGVFWNRMHAVENAAYVRVLTGRVRELHKKGIFPSGEWRFGHEEDPFEDSLPFWVCGGYLPKRISDIENIERIPVNLREYMLQNLHEYIEKKRNSTQE